MSTYDWPALKKHFQPEQMNWGAESRTLSTESILSGSVQTSGTPGKRWKVGINLPASSYKVRSKRMEIEGFLDRLNGKEHRVSLWHMGRKGIGGYGYPVGNINQTGVTVGANAAQFASTITLAGCGANTLLMAGDFFSFNGQLIMNPSTTQANGSGVMVLPAITRLRLAATAGQPVTLVRPTATFVLDSNSWTSGYSLGANQTMGIDFSEVFP
jgi:hypothetical protein